MSEELEVVKEVAKTTGKAIDIVQNFGSFISKYIGGSLEEGIGIFEDKLKYIRWERQIRLMKKAEEYMNEIGLERPNKALQLKYAIPLLQAATLEEDDFLQDLWAKLLVNSSNMDSGIDLNRTYIDILERLSSLEAHILEKIYSLSFDEIQHKGVITAFLPDYVLVKEENDKNEYKLDNEEVLFALANLSRLGCINPGFTWGGGQVLEKVNPTVLGKCFVHACTLKRP